MTLFQLEDVGDLVAPVLVAAFEGWVSAGSAGTATAEHLAGDGPVVARFDPDALYDYRANRPAVDFVDGVLTDLDWPSLSIYHRSYSGRDLLVLTGAEPNWNWRQLAGQIGELCVRLGVVEHVSLGGVPWATPHTRPTSVMVTASSADRVPTDDDRPEGLLRVPGSAVSVVEAAIADCGIPTIGFWARVPHYIATTYYPAVVALVERVATHLGIVVPFDTLIDEAADQRKQLDAILESRPEAKAVVEQLERLTETASVSGEELAAEIERFLQQRGTEDGPFSANGG